LKAHLYGLAQNEAIMRLQHELHACQENLSEKSRQVVLKSAFSCTSISAFK
jgi:hypothetical protein